MNDIMQWLAGSWFIISTNFPMWLGGHKTHPTFNYTLTTHNGKAALLDEVKYLKNGRAKTLTGYDHPFSGHPATFIWRGKGLLSIVKSKWQLRLQDPEGQWAVIWFSKTLFTPQGVDLICRTPQPAETVIKHIKDIMRHDSLLKDQVNSLTRLPH